MEALKGPDASWWNPESGAVHCRLCFRGCRLAPGQTGFCGVRENRDGRLLSPWLGRFCSAAVDPIEKKPLAFWRPGTFIYSLGSVGCTLDCPFCQNWEIARPGPRLLSSEERFPFLEPQDLARRVKDLGLAAAAFTYNEPTLQAEYILKAAPVLREAGIAVVLVTNGAVSDEAARALAPCVDAANIDLKAFTPAGYRRLGGALSPVMNTIEVWFRAGVHVELTQLIVPGLNDSEDECRKAAEWIASLSPDIPLHLTRYFPARNFAVPPTDVALLRRLASAAGERLKRVRLGNVGQ